MSRLIRRVFRLEVGRGRLRARLREIELDEEIRFHLEQRIAVFIAAGWSREQAEAEAVARFGPLQESRAQLLQSAQSRDEVLTMLDRLDHFRSDARHAARQLVRSPGLTASVVVTFALGIGANATMFGVIDRLLLRPPAFVAHPETIVQLAAGTDASFPQRTMNYPVFKALRDHAQGLNNVMATYDVNVPVGRGATAQSARGQLVTANYFSMLGVKPALGRFFRPEEDEEPSGEPVVVIGYDYWQTHFAGAASAVGAVLELTDGKFTVIGVTPRGFTGLDVSGPDMWLPMSAGAARLAFGQNWSKNAAGSWLKIFARRRPDVPADRAATDAMRIAREAAPQAWFTGAAWKFAALPLMTLRGASQGMSASVARLLGAMSLVVLLIACANVANLLLARGMRRRREIAVRLALGVSRGRLVTHLLTEAVLLALLGGFAAVLVAYWGGGIALATLFGDVNLRGSLVDLRLLAFTAMVTLITGIVTGLVPALQVSRPEISSALKSGTRDSGSQRTRTRNALLVLQTALSLILLFGAGLFVRSLAKLSAVRLGVDVDRVLVASMDLGAVGRPRSEADRIFNDALERVKALPGISAAAVAATVPFGQSFGVNVAVRGADSLMHPNAMYNVITPGYFKTLGARLMSGRDFEQRDAEDGHRVVIINQMLAAHVWGKRSPLGDCIVVGSDSLPCAEIVGIAENVRRQSIFEDSTNFVYLPMAQARTLVSTRQLIARVDRGDPASAIEPVRIAMQTAAPQLPYTNVRLFADDPTVRKELRPFRLGAAMFGVFGALALALAAVGIYGVVSYGVGQRAREIGVRIALGAQRGTVARLVVRQGVVVALIGAVIGGALSVAGAKFVAPLLYEQSARDPVLLAAVAAVLVLASIAACLVPARRAINIDPIEALRTE